MDPNTALRIGQVSVGVGFVVGLLLLRLGGSLGPARKKVVAGLLAVGVAIGWLATPLGIHARDQDIDAGIAALVAASLPLFSLSLRWWRDQRRFRIASWIGVGLSIYGVAGSVATMAIGARMSSKRLLLGDTASIIATTVASPRLPQRVVFLEARQVIAGFPAFERTKTKTSVDGITVPLSEIEMSVELSGPDIVVTMQHEGSELGEAKLSTR